MDGREGSHQSAAQADRPSPDFCCHSVCPLPKTSQNAKLSCRCYPAGRAHRHCWATQAAKRKCTYLALAEKASAGQNNVRIYITLATFDIISHISIKLNQDYTGIIHLYYSKCRYEGFAYVHKRALIKTKPTKTTATGPPSPQIKTHSSSESRKGSTI